MEKKAPNSTLEEAIKKGYSPTGFGNIGVGFTYLGKGVVPLSLRVRVLSNEYEFLSTAPYSLSFASLCCGAYHQYEFDENGDELIQCRSCSKFEAWVPTIEPLSIMGKGREYSFEHLSVAAARLMKLHPFSAVIEAADILEEISEVHAKLLTPEWAKACAEAISVKYGKPVSY